MYRITGYAYRIGLSYGYAPPHVRLVFHMARDLFCVSPHRHLPHCVQAGSGNPTAQKTYIKHFSYRTLQTCLSPSIHSQNTRTSCLQPGQVSGMTNQLRLRYSQSLKPCKLQKPIQNHQSSFCRIYLPLLSLSIIRSSCSHFYH